jgi:hypothetical protein
MGIQVTTVSQTGQQGRYGSHLKELNPVRAVVPVNVRTHRLGLEYARRPLRPTRNHIGFAGLADWCYGSTPARPVSDFATLVRKFYSDAFSRISTLVLVKRKKFFD